MYVRASVVVCDLAMQVHSCDGRGCSSLDGWVGGGPSESDVINVCVGYCNDDDDDFDVGGETCTPTKLDILVFVVAAVVVVVVVVVVGGGSGCVGPCCITRALHGLRPRT